MSYHMKNGNVKLMHEITGQKERKNTVMLGISVQVNITCANA